MKLGPKFEEAFTLAFDLHQNQKRKGSPVPYVAHLLGVSALVMDYGGDEEQAVAALLHDTLEDHGDKITLEDIKAKFGERVALIVDFATDGIKGNKLPWKERKSKFIDKIKGSPTDLRLVVACDKLHNLRSIKRSLRMDGESAWDVFSAPKAESQWWYREVVKALSHEWDHVICIELDNLVQDLC
jgi:(p)ppGpp synthase/HD superfamily hydrolase